MTLYGIYGGFTYEKIEHNMAISHSYDEGFTSENMAISYSTVSSPEGSCAQKPSFSAVGATPSRRPKLPAALVQLKLITGRCNDRFCDQ